MLIHSYLTIIFGVIFPAKWPMSHIQKYSKIVMSPLPLLYWNIIAGSYSCLIVIVVFGCFTVYTFICFHNL